MASCPVDNDSNSADCDRAVIESERHHCSSQQPPVSSERDNGTTKASERLPRKFDLVRQQSTLDTVGFESDSSSVYSEHWDYDQHSQHGREGCVDHVISSAQIDPSENISPLNPMVDVEKQAQGIPSAGVPVIIRKPVGGIQYQEPPVLQFTTSKKSIPDLDLITWDGPEDQANPHNWPKHRQWTCMLLVSMFTFISPMASTMIAPSLDTIATEFEITSSAERMLVMAIFLLAYAVGPFLWGPLSEVFGRVRVLQFANMIFLLFNTVCGFAQNKEQMMAFRFLSGIGGSAPQAIGGGVLADVFKAEERGAGIAVYSLMPFISPAVAPIMGAYLTQYTTWRWVFWSTSIFDAAVQFLCLFLLRETYAPAILHAKVKRIRARTGNTNLHTKWQGPNHTMQQILTKALVRPFIMLATQPALQAMAIFRAYQYGLMYLALATFPMVFENSYHMSVSTASLNYLSLGVGFVIGLQISGMMQDKIYQFCKRHHVNPSAPIFANSTWASIYVILRSSTNRHDSTSLPSYTGSQPTTTTIVPRKSLPSHLIKFQAQGQTQSITNNHTCTLISHLPNSNVVTSAYGLPEYRLPLTLPFSILIAIGLFTYGFSAASHTHWIVPNIGACIFAIGLIVCFNCAQAYVVDTYTTYAASATGAAAFARTMAGFAFPLFAPGLFDSLGVGWGNGMLGFVCLALGVVLPLSLWRWGAWLRGRSTYCVG